MPVLSDRDIRLHLHVRGDEYSIGINPSRDEHIQPASIDLTLGDEWITYPKTANELGLAVFESSEQQAIDMDDAKSVETERTVAEAYLLLPHKLILCTTDEFVEIPHDIVARVEGKSSLGRLGLLIHATAGFVDPGFKGKITLEMYNLNNRPILLRAGKPICQLSFLQLTSPAERPYGHPDLKSKYQNQTRVTESRYDG